MAQFYAIHPQNPQARLIKQAVDIIQRGGVIIYPTDSCYALGCHLDDKTAAERIQRIRQLENRHHFTLVCRDLSEIATYAHIEDHAYRLIKRMTPGPFTFILKASREVPRRLQNAKRKTIGIRVPDHAITHSLLTQLNEPLMSVTLHIPGDDWPMSDPLLMRERFESVVDLIIDGGACGIEPTTVIDLETLPPRLIRQGKGDASAWIDTQLA